MEKLELELVGAGGEPVDLRRTLASHGVADLLPNRLDEESWTLETTLAVRDRARTLRVVQGRAGGAGIARVELLDDRTPARERPPLTGTVGFVVLPPCSWAWGCWPGAPPPS